MQFNPYSIPPFLTAVIVFWLGVVVCNRNKESPINHSFFLLSLSILFWLFFASITYNCNQQELGIIFVRLSHLGVAFIPITMFHFIITFLNIQRTNKVLIILYFYGLLCSALFLFANVLTKGSRKYFWGYYSLAGDLHPLFLVIFISIIIFCVFLLLRSYLKEKSSLKKQQIKYVLLAFFIFDFSSVDFIANYGISFYPFGYATTTAFLLIIAYSIIKYRLLDISIAITRTTIFIGIYSFVIGIPYVLAFGFSKRLQMLFNDSWWIVPLIISTVLATLGPYIYIYIQNKAEDKLLEEQRQYQATLRQASLGMGQIKNLQRLLKLIVHIVTRAVRIEHCMIYLLHEDAGNYVLKSFKGFKMFNEKQSVLGKDSALVKYLNKTKESIIYDEIRQQAHDFKDTNFSSVERDINELKSELIVPSFIENKMIAIFVLGKKRSGKAYSQDDLAVFSILANQSALAIENAQFYEDMKKTHEQLFKAEKMATLGTMADGLSHQINNRLHALGFIAGDILDTVKLRAPKKPDKDVQVIIDEVTRGLERIQDNVKKGGEIVEGLLKYTRKGEEGFSPVELNKLLDASLEMAQFKIKVTEIDIVRNFDDKMPKIKGNFTQLQEVFFNIIDNAYDAMVQRKQELKEEGYRGRLEIAAEQKINKISIVVKDNGIGVKPEDLNKIFTPFFTTKLSSKKGTGLGMYVIRQIIEENHGGKVSFSSDFKVGSVTRIFLPMAENNGKTTQSA